MPKKNKKVDKPKKKLIKAAKPAKKAVKKVVVKAAKKAAPKKAAAAKPVAAKKAVDLKAKKALPVKAAKPVAQAKPIPEKVAKKEKGKKIKDAPEPEVAVEAEAAAAEEEEADEVVLTDAEGRRYCRVKDCDQLASVDGYCRYHYLLFWKRIQVRKKILTEGKLERYVEELTARYPDKFLDMLKKDLRSEKEFLAAIQELEIDESASENELEDETQTYIDEVRGMGEPAARDEEDF
jgi:hypothetical protein